MESTSQKIYVDTVAKHFTKSSPYLNFFYENSHKHLQVTAFVGYIYHKAILSELLKKSGILWHDHDIV